MNVKLTLSIDKDVAVTLPADFDYKKELADSLAKESIDGVNLISQNATSRFNK